MYAFIFRKIISFKRYLKDVHQWDHMSTSPARISLGYRKKRELLSPKKRKTKPREYERRQCISQKLFERTVTLTQPFKTDPQNFLTKNQRRGI